MLLGLFLAAAMARLFVLGRIGMTTALWRRVHADLEARIQSGEFAERFPTDLELTRHYAVSRHTVREAVRSLCDAGVIVRERGRGSFVADKPIEQPLGTLYSLFESIESMGLQQRSVVLSQAITTNARAAVILGCHPDAELFMLERVRLTDGEPFAHDIAWLPAALAYPLVDADFAATSLYQELRLRCDVVPREGTERIRAVIPDAIQAAHLALREGEPVLEIDRRTRWENSGLEWRITLVRGDSCVFRADWSGTTSALSPRLIPR